MIEARLRAALALEPGERTAIVEAFFGAHPGGGDGPLGLGRAIADFVDWEIHSGRITEDGGGSPWWRVVNGGMILDLRDAAAELAGESCGDSSNVESDGAPVATWVAYARCGTAPPGIVDASGSGGGDSPHDGGSSTAQARMWAAHQASLHAALEAADGAALLVGESPAEREFAGFVVAVVDATAAHGQATDTDDLARMTARSYPQQYPITPDQWQALHNRFAP